MPIKIGPTAYSRGGVLKFGYYHPDAADKAFRLAMWVENANGERQYTATVNTTGVPPGDGFVFLKHWSENDGVPEALERAGVVTLLDDYARCGHELAAKGKLTQAALDELARQNPRRPLLPTATRAEQHQEMSRGQ
jgi:hypothetical protein